MLSSARSRRFHDARLIRTRGEMAMAMAARAESGGDLARAADLYTEAGLLQAEARRIETVLRTGRVRRRT